MTQLELENISNIFKDLDAETSAEVVESLGITTTIRKNITVLKANKKMKVYIPKYMTEIQKGAPKITVAYSPNYSIFKNAKDCRPSFSSTTIKEKNCIETDLASVNVLDLDSYKSEHGHSTHVSAGLNGNVHCVGKMFSKLCFSSGSENIEFV
jgi:hypothetical protein